MLPNVEVSLKQSLGGCQVRSSPLLEEALSLGFVIRSIKPGPGITPAFSFLPLSSGVLGVVGSITPSRVRLPQGHRFYHDCLREQAAHFLEWCVGSFAGDCWFFTMTFPSFLPDQLAWGIHNRFLARLNQAYLEVPGAELLRSITSTELQQRDVIHYHSLIFGRQLRVLSRKRWENRWQSMSGGFARCYDAELKSAPYLAKHESKFSLDDSLRLGGSWRGITPPRSVSRCCSKTCPVRSNGSLNVAVAACDANGRKV